MRAKRAAIDIYSSLEAYFRPDECWDMFAPIGLQHHNTDTVERVYLATFASEPVLENVLARGVRNALLFTHHPRPPRPTETQPYPDIPEGLLKRLEAARISLFSYHIPMDRHNAYSPSYTLALALGLEPEERFYTIRGVTMGELCRGPYATLTELAERLSLAVGHRVGICRYGQDALMGGRVAIMAGCASNPDVYGALREDGVGVMLTGVTSQAPEWAKAVHEKARENGVNLLGGTHYSTEKFAPMALTRFFADMGLPAEFIPERPNMTDL